MSFFGVADKVLDIFKKPLKQMTDPSLRIERRIDAIIAEEKRLMNEPFSEDRSRKLNKLDVERVRLLKEQSRIAARSS